VETQFRGLSQAVTQQNSIAKSGGICYRKRKINYHGKFGSQIPTF